MMQPRWPTPLDRSLFVRASALLLVLLIAALLIAAATDEPSATWVDRSARLAALAPALSALAVGLVAAQMQRRSELLALYATGVSPLRAMAGAVAGTSALGLLAALALGAGQGPLTSLFPLLKQAPWNSSAEGLIAPSAGALLSASGEVRFFVPAHMASVTVDRWPVAGALALASLVAPAWTALPCSPRARASLATSAILCALVAFHAVAAGAHPAWLLSPSLLLLAHGGLAWRSARGG